MVEKFVHVESLGGEGDEGQAQVARHNGNQPQRMNGRRGLCPRNDDLEEGKEAVQTVLTDIGPQVKRRLVAVAGEQDPPVDDGDEERIADDGGVEERVQRLQWSR